MSRAATAATPSSTAAHEAQRAQRGQRAKRAGQRVAGVAKAVQLEVHELPEGVEQLEAAIGTAAAPTPLRAGKGAALAGTGCVSAMGYLHAVSD